MYTSSYIAPHTNERKEIAPHCCRDCNILLTLVKELRRALTAMYRRSLFLGFILGPNNSAIFTKLSGALWFFNNNNRSTIQRDVLKGTSGQFVFLTSVSAACVSPYFLACIKGRQKGTMSRQQISMLT